MDVDKFVDKYGPPSHFLPNRHVGKKNRRHRMHRTQLVTQLSIICSSRNILLLKNLLFTYAFKFLVERQTHGISCS